MLGGAATTVGSCIAFVGLPGLVPVPHLGAQAVYGDPCSGQAPTAACPIHAPRSSEALWHRGGVHRSLRSRRGTPHGQYEPWGSIRKYSLQFSVRTFCVFFHVHGLCVELREPGATAVVPGDTSPAHRRFLRLVRGAAVSYSLSARTSGYDPWGSAE